MTEPLWRGEDAAAATGGWLAAGAFIAEGVSIDSRETAHGDLFVALKDNRDGHDFVGAAFEAGAAAALVERPSGQGPELVVEDTLQGLRDLGAASRERCPARRVAVTGSVGKTSVKEALAAAFTLAGRAHASARSFNNHWGAPLTLARMPADTERAVFELGMNHAGELTDLSGQVRPHVAAITRIGEAHIGQLGSLEAIADAKAEIFSGLAPDGVAVVNADDPFAPRLERAAGDRRIVRFGRAEGADARLLDYRADSEGGRGRIAVFGEEIAFRVGLSGAHWGENAACVFACAALADVERETVAGALAAFEAPGGRGGVTEESAGDRPFTLIDDSYNANPASMRAAIGVLAARQPQAGGRRIAVLGEMLELGDEAAAYHAALAKPIADAGVDLVFVSGELMEALWGALPDRVKGARLTSGGDAAEIVRDAIRPGDVVLVKGSNASGMSRVAAALKGG